MSGQVPKWRPCYPGLEPLPACPSVPSHPGPLICVMGTIRLIFRVARGTGANAVDAGHTAFPEVECACPGLVKIKSKFSPVRSVALL